MSLADWCGLTGAVNVPPGGDLLQPHQVPVLDQVHDGVRVRVVGIILIKSGLNGSKTVVFCENFVCAH